MHTKSHSLKFLQRRKFYTFLPLLVLPFLTLLFWVLVGRKQHDKSQNQTHRGLILSLPDAVLKDEKSLNKLSFYQKATEDSVRLRELIKKDPYYQDTLAIGAVGPLGVPLKNIDGPQTKKMGLTRLGENPDQSQPEQQVHQKLNELHKALSQSSQPAFQPAELDKQALRKESNRDIEHLHQLMAGISEDASETDPEMDQLSGMLDKIMQIQNPELAADKLHQKSLASKKQVFSVSSTGAPTGITLLETSGLHSDSMKIGELASNSGFYSLENKNDSHANQNAVEAVVDQDQTLVSGSTVKLRLSTNVLIAGKRIPAGNFLYGKASLNQQRLRINIESVLFENALFPVNLSVYDMDGIEGIYIPGALSRDVAKQSSDRAIEAVDIPITDPSFGAQAASAGIQAAKTFMGRKAKLVQVTLKTGYRVLLKDPSAS